MNIWEYALLLWQTILSLFQTMKTDDILEQIDNDFPVYDFVLDSILREGDLETLISITDDFEIGVNSEEDYQHICKMANQYGHQQIVNYVVTKYTKIHPILNYDNAYSFIMQQNNTKLCVISTDDKYLKSHLD